MFMYMQTITTLPPSSSSATLLHFSSPLLQRQKTLHCSHRLTLAHPSTRLEEDFSGVCFRNVVCRFWDRAFATYIHYTDEQVQHLLKLSATFLSSTLLVVLRSSVEIESSADHVPLCLFVVVVVCLLLLFVVFVC